MQKDKSLAIEWYQETAAKGYPQSICYFANYYEHGIAGIELNTDVAVRLWKNAVKLGDKKDPFIH